MKRWQSKNELALLGGLFLLLLAGSAPWMNGNQLELGAANLSTMAKPDSVSDAEAAELFKPIAKDDDADALEIGQELADSEGSVKTKKKKKKGEIEVVEGDKKKYKSLQGKVKIDGELYDATLEASPTRKNTLVTISARKETEGKAPCPYCGTYNVPSPISDLESIGNDLNSYFEDKEIINISSRKKKHKLVSVENSSSDLDSAEDDEDPIIKACDRKANNRRRSSSSDSYTLCAMKELGRIANWRGDKAYDDAELKELFQTHIFSNLLSQLRDKDIHGRQHSAKTAINNLLEKLNGDNSLGLQRILINMKDEIPYQEGVKQLARIYSQMQTLPRGSRERNDLEYVFNMRRLNLEQNRNQDTMDSFYNYQNLISDDYSYQDAMMEFQTNYFDRIAPYQEALWSDDPVNSVRRLEARNNFGQIPGSPNGPGYYNRGARDRAGRNGYPGARQGRGPIPGPLANNRSLPPGPGPNQRPIYNGIPNNGYPSRFSPPVASPYYSGPGYRPGFLPPGTSNVWPAYNQPVAYNGQFNRFPAPGYMGANGMGFRSPVLNGANYYSGYGNCYGNPFAYSPVANGRFYNQGCANQGAPPYLGYPQPGLPNGAPMMSAARPRF